MTHTPEKTLRDEAEKRVLSVRGSYDAPGFDACVEAEIKEMTQELNKEGLEAATLALLAKMYPEDEGATFCPDDNDRAMASAVIQAWLNHTRVTGFEERVVELNGLYAVQNNELAEVREALRLAHADLADLSSELEASEQHFKNANSLIAEHAAEIAELNAEMDEQCRIIGMSGEAEARHLAEIAELLGLLDAAHVVLQDRYLRNQRDSATIEGLESEVKGLRDAFDMHASTGYLKAIIACSFSKRDAYSTALRFQELAKNALDKLTAALAEKGE